MMEGAVIEYSGDSLNKPVLILAEMCNPNWASVPLVGWKQSFHLAEKVPIHLVTHAVNRDDITQTNPHFPVTYMAFEWNDRFFGRFIDWFFGGDYSRSSLTLMKIPFYMWFEIRVYLKFRKQLKAGKYALVHRLTPVSPVIPSPISGLCKWLGVPFIIGPVNGGLPWPAGYQSASRDQEWISRLRHLYRYLPLTNQTRRYASLILLGSKFALAEIPKKFQEKCKYLPENGVATDLIIKEERDISRTHPLRYVFVGRFVPLKGPDLVLHAIASALKEGLVTLDFIGDGPLMAELKEFVKNNDLSDQVKFHGWIGDQKVVQQMMIQFDVLVFPSIREFGGGVVVEAMAKGVVPIVMDYGGPGEIVTDECGYKLPIENQVETVKKLSGVVDYISRHRTELQLKSKAAIKRIADHYTWEIKSDKIISFYHDILRKGSG